MPFEPELEITVFVANTGAHGALLERLSLEDFAYRGQTPLWGGITPGGFRGHVHPPGGGATAFPMPLRRDETETLILAAKLRSEPVEDARSLAERLARLEALEITVAWAFRRSRLLRPSRRVTVRRSQTITLSGDRVRAPFLSYWRGTPAYHEYAELADGKPPDQ